MINTVEQQGEPITMIENYCGRWKSLLMLALLWSIVAVGCTGISSHPQDNNHLTIPDLLRFFEKSGLRIESITLLRRDVASADDAVAIRIDGNEVGIYKYNSRLKKQREKLDYIKLHGVVYLAGIKKKALVNGTFVLVGMDDNRQRLIIEKVFNDFK